MSEQKSRRKRAVKLTQEAHEMLIAGLQERWRLDGQASKLTREERARLLGVSVATADRISKREGVDRPTLSLAFKNVGLTWEDSYCELASGESEAPIATETAPVAPAKRFPWHLAAAAVLLVILGSIAATYGQRPLPPSRPEALKEWERELSAAVAQGTDDYGHSRYPQARARLKRAIYLAEAHYDVGGKASALKVLGDVEAAEGNFAAAKSTYYEAKALRESLRQANCVVPLVESIGCVELREGHLKAAEQHLTFSLRRYQQLRDKVAEAAVCRYLGSLEQEKGNPSGAATYLQRGLNILLDFEQPGMVADLQARYALVQRDQERYADARERLLECLAYWEKEAQPRWVATTKLQLATVELLDGNPAKAGELLAASKAGYEAVGDRASMSECDRWIARVSEPNSSLVVRR